MSAHASRPGLIGELRHYWHGEGPLWKLYWVYGVLLSTLGGTFLMAGVLRHALPMPLLLAILAAGLAYTGFILVSIWRSAFNIAGTPLGIEAAAWGWLARALTFGWALNAGGAALMLLQYALDY